MGAGNVHDFTLAELRKLDAGMWFDREFMGQRIPTLEEVLQFGKEHDVIFYLEVKYDAAWGMHHSLVAELHKSQSTARSIVISFDESTLTALRHGGFDDDDGVAGGSAAGRFRESCD